MNNWPQIPASIAEFEYLSIVSSADEPKPRTRHPDQIYSPVGGRVADSAVQRLIDEMTVSAGRLGYPDAASAEARIQFDRDGASILRSHMDISWADAGNGRLWSFVSLVALPHLTHWRFGTGNRERWIGSDLTRHTWARLWWQAIVFEDHEELLGQLNESELNQLLERRTIGGDPRLVRTFAKAVVQATEGGGRRRVIRDATKRLRRLLAFVDSLALDDAQVQEMCTAVVADSATQLGETTSLVASGQC
jgi:hypothetical protein